MLSDYLFCLLFRSSLYYLFRMATARYQSIAGGAPNIYEQPGLGNSISTARSVDSLGRNGTYLCLQCGGRHNLSLYVIE